MFDPTARFLAEVAETGGGNVLNVASFSEVERAFLAILDEMKTRYRLFYVPQGVERTGWHDLKITIKEPGVKVRARPGYWHGR